MKTVLQLIPAHGWSAVFANRPSRTGGTELYTVRLCSWALVEEEQAGETFRSIYGYGATDIVDDVEGYEGFIGYVHQTDPEGPEKYMEAALRYVHRLEKQAEKRVV
jgi:hypothetical protein